MKQIEVLVNNAENLFFETENLAYKPLICSICLSPHRQKGTCYTYTFTAKVAKEGLRYVATCRTDPAVSALPAASATEANRQTGIHRRRLRQRLRRARAVGNRGSVRPCECLSRPKECGQSRSQSAVEISFVAPDIAACTPQGMRVKTADCCGPQTAAFDTQLFATRWYMFCTQWPVTLARAHVRLCVWIAAKAYSLETRVSVLGYPALAASVLGAGRAVLMVAPDMREPRQPARNSACNSACNSGIVATRTQFVQSTNAAIPTPYAQFRYLFDHYLTTT